MASISCLIWLIGVAQGAAAADCSGSSCLPRSSLLQVKSNTRRQSASLETHSSLKAQVAEYTKFTEGLVAKYGEDPVLGADGNASESSSPEATKDELEAVRVVLQFIDDMYQSLLHWHDIDVDKAAQCDSEAIVKLCDLTAKQSQEINDRREQVDLYARQHEACRSKGVTVCPPKPQECPDYDNYRKDQGDYHGKRMADFGLGEKVPDSPLRTLPSCVQVSPDSAAFADASIQTTDPGQLQTMEDCLRQTKNWLDPLYNRYKACERQEETCQENCQECREEQTLFEEQHCIWYAYLATGCSEVQNCGEDATNLCKTTCSDIEVRESARIADNETGQRLVCLLHVIFGKPENVTDEFTAWEPRPSAADRPEALKACKTNRYITPTWNIKCDPEDWASPAPCDEFDLPTCSDQFQQKWYIDRDLQKPCTQECSCQQQAFGKHVDECTLSDGICKV